MSISILIADDHAIARHGLRSLLEAESDMRMIGAVENGLEAVEQKAQEMPTDSYDRFMNREQEMLQLVSEGNTSGNRRSSNWPRSLAVDRNRPKNDIVGWQTK